jgi:hypothetical protein
MVPNSNNPIVSIARRINQSAKLSDNHQGTSGRRQVFTNQQRNSAVLLSDGRIGLITYEHTDSTSYHMKVLPSDILDNIFERPCKSKVLSMFKVHADLLPSIPAIRIPKTDVSRQCVFIPMNKEGTEMAIIPLRHEACE